MSLYLCFVYKFGISKINRRALKLNCINTQMTSFWSLSINFWTAEINFQTVNTPFSFSFLSFN